MVAGLVSTGSWVWSLSTGKGPWELSTATNKLSWPAVWSAGLLRW